MCQVGVTPQTHCSGSRICLSSYKKWGTWWTGPYERANLNIRVQWPTGSFSRAQQNSGYAFISGVVCT